jgi:hypothetical protein
MLRDIFTHLALIVRSFFKILYVIFVSIYFESICVHPQEAARLVAGLQREAAAQGWIPPLLT